MSRQKPSDEIEYELGLARSMLGTELSEDCKARLRRVVNNPTIKNWDNASGIILNAEGINQSTLWQCVTAVDPSFPHVGRKTDQRGRVLREWERAPEREILIEAIKFGVH